MKKKLHVTTADFDVSSIDRDHFSDLTESSILTFFVHMVPPFKQGYDPNFHSKLIGKRIGFLRRLRPKDDC